VLGRRHSRLRDSGLAPGSRCGILAARFVLRSLDARSQVCVSGCRTANESVVCTFGEYGVTVRGCYTYRIKIRLLLEQLLARVGR
jgi:hypothetical protein